MNNPDELTHRLEALIARKIAEQSGAEEVTVTFKHQDGLTVHARYPILHGGSDPHSHD